jgi:general transcription factor 3C polypeptide 5 (transcription factor C subunit 1)
MKDTTSSSAQIQNSNGKPVAPFIPISQDPIICVEHPCIIKNLERGIKSLGGEYGINKVSDYDFGTRRARLKYPL